jgi:heme exporter protein A
MNNYIVELNAIGKYFGRRLVFNGINYTFTSGNIYGISGPNGSGKSTLVKIIAGLISPTSGKVNHSLLNKIIEPEKLHNHIGFVSPYLFLYDEFTAEENLIHFFNIRGLKFDTDRTEFLLNELNLFNRRKDLVRGYSSGMKQRLKFIFALLHQPRFLILDEPTSNLDNEGKEKVYKLVQNESCNNLIVIASNEDSDLRLCSSVIELEKYKNRDTGK